jgi:type I restriction enzyme, S subunit
MPESVKKGVGTTVSFGEVVLNRREQIQDRKSAGIERIVGLDDLVAGDLRIRSWKSTGESPSFKTHFKPGQTLFGKRRAYLRKVAFAKFEGVCTQNILVLESKEPGTLLPELLPFLCSTDAFFDHAVDTSEGSLFPNANWKAMQEFEFILPPLEEQRRIVDVLQAMDALKFALDESLRSAETALAAEREFLIGRHQPAAHLGSAPSKTIKWSQATIGELAELQMGFAFKSTWFTESGVQLLRMGNIRDARLDLESAPVFLSEEMASEYCNYILQPGDIAVSMTGTLGKRDYGFALRIPDGCPQLLLNQRICRIRARGSINQIFLAELARTEPFLQEVYSTASGNKQANLSHKSLANMAIAFPERQDQELILGKMLTCIRGIQVLSGRLEACKAVAESAIAALSARTHSARVGRRERV